MERWMEYWMKKWTDSKRDDGMENWDNGQTDGWMETDG